MSPPSLPGALNKTSKFLHYIIVIQKFEINGMILIYLNIGSKLYVTDRERTHISM